MKIDSNITVVLLRNIPNLLGEAEEHAIREGNCDSTVKKKIGKLYKIFTNFPDKITPEGFYRWLDSLTNLRGGRIGAAGKNNYISALKWFLNRTDSVKNGRIFAERLRTYSIPRTSRRIIGSEEFERIIQYLPDIGYETACRLMFETGLRPAETVSLRTGNIKPFPVNIKGKKLMGLLITVPGRNPKVPSGRNKTGGRETIMFSYVEEILSYRKMRIEKSIKENGETDPFLFDFDSGKLSAHFYNAKRKAYGSTGDRSGDAGNTAEEMGTGGPISDKKPPRLYDLRHRAITKLYASGIPDQVIRSMVGWKPASKMPDVYVHISRQHIVDALKKMGTGYYSRPIENDIEEIEDTDIIRKKEERDTVFTF